MSVYVAGGFGEASTSPMSDGLRIRSEADDQIEAERGARADRKRAERAERLQEEAVQASIAMAIEAGENVNVRAAMAAGGVGHQPHEFIASRALLMDHEDAHLEAQQAAEYRRWQAEHYAGTSADTSAPTEQERAATQRDREQLAAHKQRMYERGRAVEEARKLARQDSARGDRQIVGAVAAALGEAGHDNHAGYQTTYRMT
jgi:hypothetical protein